MDLDGDCTCESLCGECNQCSGRGREHLSLETSDVSAFLFPSNSKVCREVDNGIEMFTSSIKGSLADNPTDPLMLTDFEISLAVGKCMIHVSKGATPELCVFQELYLNLPVLSTLNME